MTDAGNRRPWRVTVGVMARGRARRAADNEVRAGDVIRSARQKRGWSQERLAAELDALLRGQTDETVSQGAVSNWEHGLTTPTPSKVPTIERVLRIADGQLARLYYGTAVTDHGSAPVSQDDQISRIERELQDLRRLVEEFVAHFDGGGAPAAGNRRSGGKRAGSGG